MQTLKQGLESRGIKEGWPLGALVGWWAFERQCGTEVTSPQGKGPGLCPHQNFLGFHCSCFGGEKVWTPWSFGSVVLGLGRRPRCWRWDVRSVSPEMERAAGMRADLRGPFPPPLPSGKVWMPASVSLILGVLRRRRGVVEVFCSLLSCMMAALFPCLLAQVPFT